MKVTPYITVVNAKKTIKVYEKLFRAKQIDHMPFDKNIGTQMSLPEDFDYENSTMHAVLDFRGNEVYISDSMTATSSGPVEIVLDFESREEIEAVWAIVLEMNLKIVMALEPQFWGALYGRFIDNDNIGWQLNYNLPQE
jgi:uncharacterized glyoxalase superfamily protein PhnB